MKCKNYLDIRIEPIRTPYRVDVQKEIVSFDTETRKGKPFLMCDSIGNVLTDQDSIINHLLSFQDTLNTFYNLSYDKNAILKFLPKENLKQFAKIEYTIHDNIFYGGIGSKCFDIAYCKPYEKGKKYIDLEGNEYELYKKCKYFDILQFFKFEKSAKLEYVASKYLNDHKKDIASLGYDIGNLPLDDTVIEYCLHDAYLTKQLSEIVKNSCNHIGMIFNAPYSCATLSGDYFYKTQNELKPYVVKNPKYWFFSDKFSERNYEIGYYAYNSYAGGRAEVTKRGTYNNVYEYDVTSMYPYQMTFLEDINKLKWIKIKSIKELIDYDIDTLAYGFVKCSFTLPNRYILPIPYKDNILKYSYGNYKEYFLSLEELKLLVKHNLLEWNDINIISGYIGQRFDNDVRFYPFRDTVNLLFDERKKYEKTDFRNLLFKILLNSIYGRFIEVNANFDISDTIDLSDIDSYVIDIDDVVAKTWHCGNYFNPLYACYITANARCMVYSAAMQKEDAFIASFTDSVITEDRLELDEGKELGQWECTEGDLFIVGGGFYTLEGDQVNKARTRGVHVTKTTHEYKLSDIDFNNIFDYGYNETRVRKLKECVIQNDMDNFNCFDTKLKLKEINFDKKRKWDFDYKNISECRKIQCNSKPLKTPI